jgi:hypothetical protein
LEASKIELIIFPHLLRNSDSKAYSKYCLIMLLHTLISFIYIVDTILPFATIPVLFL